MYCWQLINNSNFRTKTGLKVPRDIQGEKSREDMASLVRGRPFDSEGGGAGTFCK